jgi:hypothetical protein
VLHLKLIYNEAKRIKIINNNMNIYNVRCNRNLNNGIYISYKLNKETHSHYTRILRNKYKINILIQRQGWTYEIFKTYYFPKSKSIIVLDYNFKLLEPSVKNTNSLKYCGKEQVFDYYNKYIDNTLSDKNIKWN